MKKFLIFLSFALIFSLTQIYFWKDTCDDSYITFRYVERFLEGKGITFNDNERVEGFSHPLWFFLLSFLKFIFPFELEFLSHCLGFLASLILLYFLTKNEGLFPSALGGLLLLSTPAFLYYSTSGLETPLFALFIFLSFYFKENLVLSGLFLGLLSITRPEGFLYGLLFFLFNFKFKEKKWLTSIILFLIPFISYEIFRIIYFKDIFPNTFYAKPSGIYGSSGGFYYLFPWIYAIGGPFVFILFFYSKIPREAIGLFLANLIFLFYTQGDWMSFGRLIFPVFPLLLFIFSKFLFETLNFLKEKFPLKNLIFLILLPLFSLIVWYPQIYNYFKNEGLNVVMKGKDQILVGEWLDKNIKKNTKIATIRLGGLSYKAKDLIFLDLYGLTDREQGKWVYDGKKGGILNSPILKKGVDIFACVNVPAKWGYRNDPEFLRYLEENYEFIISFKQGNFGTMDIWAKRGENFFK